MPRSHEITRPKNRRTFFCDTNLRGREGRKETTQKKKSRPAFQLRIFIRKRHRNLAGFSPCFRTPCLSVSLLSRLIRVSTTSTNRTVGTDSIDPDVPGPETSCRSSSQLPPANKQIGGSPSSTDRPYTAPIRPLAPVSCSALTFLHRERKTPSEGRFIPQPPRRGPP